MSRIGRWLTVGTGWRLAAAEYSPLWLLDEAPHHLIDARRAAATWNYAVVRLLQKLATITCYRGREIREICKCCVTGVTGCCVTLRIAWAPQDDVKNEVPIQEISVAAGTTGNERSSRECCHTFIAGDISRKENATALNGSEAAKICPLGAGANRPLTLGGVTSDTALRGARNSVCGSCDSHTPPRRRKQSPGNSRYSTAAVEVLQAARGSSLQGAFYRYKKGGLSQHEGQKAAKEAGFQEAQPFQQQLHTPAKAPARLARNRWEDLVDSRELLPVAA